MTPLQELRADLVTGLKASWGARRMPLATGQHFRARCRKLVEQIRALDDAIDSHQLVASGMLQQNARVNERVAIGRWLYKRALGRADWIPELATVFRRIADEIERGEHRKENVT